jgi:hypothetical protein
MMVNIWVMAGGYLCFRGRCASTLKMEAVCSSKILVTTYQPTWCYDAEDHTPDVNCCLFVVYLMMLFNLHGFYSVE